MIAPGVCPLNNKLYKSPPMPGRGEVGFNIDKCITLVFLNSSQLTVGMSDQP